MFPVFKTRNIQPQTNVEIDWSNPDTTGLTLVYVPSIFNGNLVTRTNAITVADKTNNYDGVAAYWGAAFSNDPVIFTSSWSWVALFKTRTIGTGTNRYVLSRGPTSVVDSTGFGFAAFHGNAAYSGAVFTTDAYSIIGKPTGGPLADNTRYLLGATFAGGSGAVYNNGVETATATGLSGTVNNTGRLSLGESSIVAGNAMQQNAEWNLYLQWNRRLDAAAMARIHANPWKLFKPRLINVSVLPGSGTTWTITPSGGITLAGTNTFQHNRVYSISGGLTFSGTNLFVHNRLPIISGGISFTGSAPISTTSSTTWTITPAGGVTLSGTAETTHIHTVLPNGGIAFNGTNAFVKTHIEFPSGNITFSGTNNMQFIPFGSSTVTTYRPLTGAGL